MTEPIKWHEPKDNNEFLTFEDVDKMMKSYNPTQFRRQYLNVPQKPEELIGALQDPVHRDVGRSRPARVSRSHKP